MKVQQDFMWITKILLVFLLCCISSNNVNGSNSCVPKYFGEGRMVCVCNATYCDDIDPIILPPDGQFFLYTSSRSGQRFELAKGEFKNISLVLKVFPKDSIITHVIAPKPMVTVSITRVKKSKILGYGGAFTDAAGINIRSLSPEAQEKLISSYYGPNGIGYTLGRIPIGGCDFSPRPYTYADIAGDVNLTHFKLQEEDYLYKIPFLKMAASFNPEIRLYGSPWTAPPWMKTNNDYIGHGLLKPEYYQTWANYFVKFLEAYKIEGFNIWGVTTQNEPLDGLVPMFPFNCMGWTAPRQRDWIKNNLGPTIKNSEFKDLKIIILDENTLALPRWPQEILQDKEAAQYVFGIGIHWYSTEMTKHDPILQTHRMFPDTVILSTEACAGFLPWEREKVSLGSWERGENYAYDILEGIRNYVTGWTDWNIALSPKGGPNWAKLSADSAIIVNDTSDEFYKQPMYYGIGHISKFFLPDSDVLDVDVSYTDQEKSIVVSAVERPDGSKAVTILNRNDQEVDLLIKDEERGETKLRIPMRSLQTIVYS